MYKILSEAGHHCLCLKAMESVSLCLKEYYTILNQFISAVLDGDHCVSLSAWGQLPMGVGHGAGCPGGVRGGQRRDPRERLLFPEAAW